MKPISLAYGARFGDLDIWEHCPAPERLKLLSERICSSYNIGGLCDPAYIANVIAFELGLGDGHGTFDHDKIEWTEKAS